MGRSQKKKEVNEKVKKVDEDGKLEESLKKRPIRNSGKKQTNTKQSSRRMRR